MSLRVTTAKRGYWKEIHPNIIFYNQDLYSSKHPLKIQNIESSINIEYKEIYPNYLGLIQKILNQLFIVIETSRYSLFAKLEIDSLKVKKIYKIFQQFLFYGNPIFQNHHSIFYFIQGKQLVIIHKNKLIQKLQCDIAKSLPEQLLIQMILKSFNGFRQFSIDSIMNKLQSTFEQLQNIQISQINQEHGNHIFKRIGDFIILKHQTSFLLKQQPPIPTYYMEVSILNQMTGQYGSIQIEKNEKLKVMKVLDNKLFIIIRTGKSMSIFRIQDKQRILIFEMKYQCRTFKKPTFNMKYLVLTDRYCPVSEPLIKKIDLDKS